MCTTIASKHFYFNLTPIVQELHVYKVPTHTSRLLLTVNIYFITPKFVNGVSDNNYTR